jgi:hypothetical protein
MVVQRPHGSLDKVRTVAANFDVRQLSVQDGILRFPGCVSTENTSPLFLRGTLALTGGN